MKYYIGSYTYKHYNKIIREYYISEGELIVAGDFKSYFEAKNYIKNVLLKR